MNRYSLPWGSNLLYVVYSMLSNVKNVFFGGQVRSRFPISSEENGQKVGDVERVRYVLSNTVNVVSDYHIG